MVYTMAVGRSLLFISLCLLIPAGGSLGVCRPGLTCDMWIRSLMTRLPGGFVRDTVGVCGSWPVVAGHSIPV